MNLDDILDANQLERLIEQHDRYTIFDCEISRESHWHPKHWYVYWKGKAIQTYETPTREPVSYFRLANAINAAYCFNIRVEDGEIKP